MKPTFHTKYVPSRANSSGLTSSTTGTTSKSSLQLVAETMEIPKRWRFSFGSDAEYLDQLLLRFSLDGCLDFHVRFQA